MTSLSRTRTIYKCRMQNAKKFCILHFAFWIRLPCTFFLWQVRPECAAPAYSGRELSVPANIVHGYIVPDAESGLLVSSKEQKILGLSNHRIGDYSFPINAANTSSNFHLILICSASYTRTCSTNTRSSSFVSVFASLY